MCAIVCVWWKSNHRTSPGIVIVLVFNGLYKTRRSKLFSIYWQKWHSECWACMRKTAIGAGLIKWMQNLCTMTFQFQSSQSPVPYASSLFSVEQEDTKCRLWSQIHRCQLKTSLDTEVRTIKQVETIKETRLQTSTANCTCHNMSWHGSTNLRFCLKLE
jgi:hypothetical protein